MEHITKLKNEKEKKIVQYIYKKQKKKTKTNYNSCSGVGKEGA